VFVDRNVVLKIGEAKALGPLLLSVFNYGHGQTGDMGRSHEFGNGGIDLCEFAGRKFAILSLANSGTQLQSAWRGECSWTRAVQIIDPGLVS
jgi:hypothetical protein